jgi:hypothetical protein
MDENLRLKFVNDNEFDEKIKINVDINVDMK